MALPDSLTAALGVLLTNSWADIVEDANANGGKTNLSFNVSLTETSPPGGPMDYVIDFNHRYRTEVSQSQSERVTGSAS